MGSSTYRKATMKAPQTLAQRIRARRKALELTQEQLAKRSGVKQSTISLIESGQTLWLKGTTLLRLAAALGVTPEWINTGNEVGTSKAIPSASEHELVELVELFRL